MGYVNDTSMSAFTTPAECTGTVGTWAMAQASHAWTLNHTAADNTSLVKIPLKLPANSKALKGALLKSIDIFFSNATADCDAVSAELYVATLPTAGTGGSLAPGSAVTCTYDADHDTAAKRYAQATHRMTLNVTTPVWIDEDNEAYVELTIDAAATSVVKLMGARANYTLRI